MNTPYARQITIQTKRPRTAQASDEILRNDLEPSKRVWEDPGQASAGLFLRNDLEPFERVWEDPGQASAGLFAIAGVKRRLLASSPEIPSERQHGNDRGPPLRVTP